MSNYQEETKSYYKEIYKKACGNKISNDTDNLDRSYDDNKSTILNFKQNIIKRVIQEFAITFLLFIFIIGCKLINTSSSMYVYKYAKNMLTVDLSKEVLNNINIEDIKKKFNDTIYFLEHNTKSNNDSSKNQFENIKKDIIVPVNGDCIEDKDKIITGKGVLIKAKEGSDIFNPYDGIVRRIIKDDDGTREVIVDNDNGIEVVCGGLKDVYIKEGDKVEKGEVLGKSGNIGKNKTAAIIFKVIFKGEEKDPKEVMNLK